MRSILITSKLGQKMLARHEDSRNLLQDFEIIIYNESGTLGPEIDSMLDAWESLRQQGGQATRYNNPYGFGRSLLNSAYQDEQDCALLIFDGSDIHAAMHGKLKYSRFRHGPLSLPVLTLIEMFVEYTAFVHDGSQKTLNTMHTLLSNFTRKGVLDCIELKNIEINSTWYDAITNNTENKWKLIQTPKIRWQTELLDPKTKQRIQHNSSKTRSTQRRKDKRLVEYFDGEVEMKVITDDKDVDDFIIKASSIVDQTYQSSLNIGVREDNEPMRAFLHELAEDGFLRAYLLMAKEEAIAYVLGDVYSGKFSLWATSYLPEYSKLSPGNVLIRRILDDLAENHVMVFDFGWGESIYKKVFGSQKINENDVRIYAPRLKPKMVYVLELTLIRTKRLIRHLLDSMNLMDSLRSAWRKYLKPTNKQIRQESK